MSDTMITIGIVSIFGPIIFQLLWTRINKAIEKSLKNLDQEVLNKLKELDK